MPPLAAASARVGWWAVATSAVASPAARRGRMERADLLLMVALERLLLLGVALLELLLRHHMDLCVVLFCLIRCCSKFCISALCLWCFAATC